MPPTLNPMPIEPEVQDMAQLSQTSGTDLNADELAAALGFITNISEKTFLPQMMKQEMPEQPMKSSEVVPELAPQLQGLEQRLTEKIESLKEDIKPANMSDEISKLRSELETIMNEENDKA